MDVVVEDGLVLLLLAGGDGGVAVLHDVGLAVLQRGRSVGDLGMMDMISAQTEEMNVWL